MDKLVAQRGRLGVIIAALVERGYGKYRLSRGLVLSYRKGTNGQHVLVCGRNGVKPGEREIRLVKAACRDATDYQQGEIGLEEGEIKGWLVVALTWPTVEQGELFSEAKTV